MCLLKLTWVLLLVVTTECSMVLDSTNQGRININDYCPTAEHCPEGTHVLCMYYDPVNLMGPNCANGKNITVTDEFVNNVLEYVNMMRINVANGHELGKNREPLPRGYGMIRTKWDAELATFAQIWANQCINRRDLCRATRKFSSPGQSVSFTKFSFYDWNSEKPGFIDNRVMFSLKKFMSDLKNQKSSVTKEMIYNSPDDLTDREYLLVVNSATTHVGCGVSITTEFIGSIVELDEPQVHANIVVIVCNFAGTPTPGQKVYETNPPTHKTWTEKCSCPPGYLEDENCLCVESKVPINKTDNKIAIREKDDDQDSQQSVILLPIFEVEDAPSEKLYHPHKIGATRRKDVRKQYFDVVLPEHRHRKSGSSVFGRGHVSTNKFSQSSRRDSIFTKVSIFKLPVQNNNNHFEELQEDGYKLKNMSTKIIKDVTPRKDFSTVQKVATAYLNKKNYEIAKYGYQPVTVKYKEQSIYNIPPKVRKYDFQDFISPTTNRNYRIEYSTERDQKISSLLRNLDQEVNHGKINQNIEEIIDEKAHKIYGNGVGHTDHLLKFNHRKLPEGLIDDIEHKNRINKLRFRDKDIVLSDFGSETRPMKRKQSVIKLHDKPSFVQYQKEYGTLDEDQSDGHANYFKKTIDPYVEGIEMVHYEKYTDNENNNDDGHQNPDKIINKSHLLHAYQHLEAKRKYFRDELGKLDRQIQNLHGTRHRNEEHRDNGHHFRRMISPHTPLKNQGLLTT